MGDLGPPPSAADLVCPLPPASGLWNAAYEVVLRELVRAGRDGNPVQEATRFVEAMRASGQLEGYRRASAAEQCTPHWAELACLAWWWAGETPERREDALRAIRTHGTPWGSAGLQPPTLRCSAGEATWCCPAIVHQDPLYGAQVHELYAMAQARGTPAQSKPSNLPIWLVAIAAVGSFSLALFSFVASRSKK